MLLQAWKKEKAKTYFHKAANDGQKKNPNDILL